MFTPAKLEKIVVRVCREFGKDAAKAACRDGLTRCDDADIRLPCELIDELEDLLRYWATELGWQLDLINWIYEKWELIRHYMPLIPRLPTFFGAREFLNAVRDGSLVARLQRIREASGCAGTGGGF